MLPAPVGLRQVRDAARRARASAPLKARAASLSCACRCRKRKESAIALLSELGGSAPDTAAPAPADSRSEDAGAPAPKRRRVAGDAAQADALPSAASAPRGSASAANAAPSADATQESSQTLGCSTCRYKATGCHRCAASSHMLHAALADSRAVSAMYAGARSGRLGRMRSKRPRPRHWFRGAALPLQRRQRLRVPRSRWGVRHADTRPLAATGPHQTRDPLAG